MKVLIIGGAGFLGYNLSQYLSKKNFIIDIIDDNVNALLYRHIKDKILGIHKYQILKK